jgi:DNA replication protein DnaC
VLYYRVPRLLDALALARGDGRVELLILDDWGLAPLTSQQGRDLLEIVDDRHGRGSTIVTSQLGSIRIAWMRTFFVRCSSIACMFMA